jgi:hypothetical protein
LANDITSAIWRLDTAPFTTAGNILRVKIINLNITDATAADHVVLKDLNGKTIVDFTANASELDYRIGNLGWVNGIVIASGGLGTSAVVTIAVGAGK